MKETFTDLIFSRSVDMHYKLELDAPSCACATWEGRVLKSDWLAVSGLRGCLGIICIDPHPVVEPYALKNTTHSLIESHKKNARHAINQRSAIPSALRSMLPRNAPVHDLNVKQGNHSFRYSHRPASNGSHKANHRPIESHGVFMIHDMSQGHFIAKEKLEKYFRGFPGQKSLKIYYYCKTDFGQLEWLIRERGKENIFAAANQKPDEVVARGGDDALGAATLLASPSYNARLVEYEHGKQSSRAALPKRLLEEDSFREIIQLGGSDSVAGNVKNEWAGVVERNLKTLQRTTEEKHNQKECEICRKKVDKAIYSFFKAQTSARHHCRACAKTVCGNCCTKLSSLRKNGNLKFIADDGLESYICKNCNSLRW